MASGAGNAVTAVTLSSDKKTLTVTKGATFLTAHQSLANYVTLNTAQTITAQKTSGRPASSWYNGRDNALFRVTKVVNNAYYPLFSIKTPSGSWEVGNHIDESLLFTHISDANYSAGTNVFTSQIKFNSNGSVTAGSFIKSGGTSSQFLKANGSVDSTTYATAAQLTNGTVTKVGTATVGGTAKPMYLNAGIPTALSATVGSATRPVYLNAGTITAGTYTFGNASGNAPISNGTVNTNLNADMLDGIHANGLFTALTRTGAHNNTISATIGGTTKTVTLYPISTWGMRYVNKTDNGGRAVIVLIADITSWKGSTSNASHYGFTGRVTETRTGGYMGEKQTDVICRCGYADETGTTCIHLRTSYSNYVCPKVILYNLKYYLVLWV